jgi:hypothetical protein
MPETTSSPDEHEGHAFVASGSHAGRAKSWLAITVIILGFIVGGVGLCLGPNWYMFFAGVRSWSGGAARTASGARRRASSGGSPR